MQIDQRPILESTRWGITLPKEDFYISNSLQLNLLYLQKNFVRIFKDLVKLPIFLQMAGHWNVPHLLSSIISVMNSGFSSRNCMYPLDNFMKLTLIPNEEIARQVFQDHNLELISGIDEREYVRFYKQNFQPGASICHYKMKNIEEVLNRGNLSDLFPD